MRTDPYVIRILVTPAHGLLPRPTWLKGLTAGNGSSLVVLTGDPNKARAFPTTSEAVKVCPALDRHAVIFHRRSQARALLRRPR